MEFDSRVTVESNRLWGIKTQEQIFGYLVCVFFSDVLYSRGSKRITHYPFILFLNCKDLLGSFSHESIPFVFCGDCFTS